MRAQPVYAFGPLPMPNTWGSQLGMCVTFRPHLLTTGVRASLADRAPADQFRRPAQRESKTLPSLPLRPWRALAAGLHASRLSGCPLDYNQPHPYLPDLLICRPELARRLVEAVAE
jgi:hypothetical protein